MNEEFISGIILTNTTISRDMLYKKPVKDSWKFNEEGGLSGKPLIELTNNTIEKAYEICRGKLLIIGVGEYRNGKDAFEKNIFEANALQLYTALVYKDQSCKHDFFFFFFLEDLSKKVKEKEN